MGRKGWLKLRAPFLCHHIYIFLCYKAGKDSTSLENNVTCLNFRYVYFFVVKILKLSHILFFFYFISTIFFLK